jgi:phage repressor protein C with HTH and peptisase S24 domain
MKKMLPKNTSKKKNITLIPMKAIGGNIPFSTETVRGSETFSIPGLHGELYAFEVEEDSMTPNINHGDMVICREWNQQYDELRKDAAYVIITSDGAKVKRLERKYEDCKFTHWVLKSDNPTIPSDVISVADVTSIFLVVRVLSRYCFNESNENQQFDINKEFSLDTKVKISDDVKENMKFKISKNCMVL